MLCAMIYGLSDPSVFIAIVSQMAASSKKHICNEMCFDFLYNLYLKHFFLISGRIRQSIINVLWLSCKVPHILSDFNESWIFSTDFNKRLQYKITRKSCPVGVELFQAVTDRQSDRQTDMMKPMAAFPDFTYAAKLYTDVHTAEAASILLICSWSSDVEERAKRKHDKRQYTPQMTCADSLR